MARAGGEPRARRHLPGHPARAHPRLPRPAAAAPGALHRGRDQGQGQHGAPDGMRIARRRPADGGLHQPACRQRARTLAHRWRPRRRCGHQRAGRARRRARAAPPPAADLLRAHLRHRLPAQRRAPGHRLPVRGRAGRPPRLRQCPGLRGGGAHPPLARPPQHPRADPQPPRAREAGGQPSRPAAGHRPAGHGGGAGDLARAGPQPGRSLLGAAGALPLAVWRSPATTSRTMPPPPPRPCARSPPGSVRRRCARVSPLPASPPAARRSRRAGAGCSSTARTTGRASAPPWRWPRAGSAQAGG